MNKILSHKIIFYFVLLLILASLIAACAEENAAAKPLNPQAAAGKQVFRRHCSSCHSTFGETVIVGPSLAGIATRAATREEGLSAHEYILISIIKPDAYLVEGYKEGIMLSNFGTKLSGEELDNLVAYLETLE